MIQTVLYDAMKEEIEVVFAARYDVLQACVGELFYCPGELFTALKETYAWRASHAAAIYSQSRPASLPPCRRASGMAIP